MNRIGIIGAMDEEVAILIGKMNAETVIHKANMDFYIGELLGKEVVIVKSGIGKVNAAVCTQILIDDFNIGFVINTGVAGSLKNEINIGDIVLSSDCQQHDMDATGFGYRRGIIPRMQQSVFPADKKMVELAKVVCEEVNPDIQVFVGRIVSGDQFISNHDKKEMLARDFNGYCTEMEGAAIAQAAYLNNIPYVVIRAVSDKADNSAEMDYSEFEKKAITHTVNLMEGFLKKL